MAGRHKGDTKGFRELTFAEQARSINATVINLQAAIEHHIEQSPQRPETIEKCLAQVDRLRQRLRVAYHRDARPSPGGMVADAQAASVVHVVSPRLARPELAADFAMEVVEAPRDAGRL